jgi:hypothetical protein
MRRHDAQPPATKTKIDTASNGTTIPQPNGTEARLKQRIEVD